MLETQVLPNAEDVAFFEENGYWIAPKIIDDNRLNELREHMTRIHNQEFETGRAPWPGYWQPAYGDGLRKSDNTHWSDMTLRGLATDSVIGAIAARLMGASSIRLWHDQLLYKPGSATNEPPKKVNVGWHQDYFYWQCAERPSLLTAWVAFDDVDLSNGCMKIVRGSNQWGLVKINDFFDQDTQRQEAQMEIPAGKRFEAVPLIMRAGQVSFHHCMTLHGSGPNLTFQPRRSLAVHLMTGDTRYRSGTLADGHMNVELLQPRDGDLFAGELFPVLFDSSKP